MKIQRENSGNQTVILELISLQVNSRDCRGGQDCRGDSRKNTSHASSRHFGHAPSTHMAEGTTGSPARGSAAPPSGGLPTGFIVVAVLLAFAGASSCICITLIFPRQPVGSESTRRCGAPTRAANQTTLTRYPSRTKHAGADVFSTFKDATQISDSVASAPVDRHSLGGKVHISFCQS